MSWISLRSKFLGEKRFAAPNPEIGAPISYYLAPGDETATDEGADRRLRVESIEKLLQLLTETYEAKNEAESLNEKFKDWETETEADEKERRRVAELAHKLDRLHGRVTQLYRAMTDSPFAPTQTQIRMLTELAAEGSDVNK